MKKIIFILSLVFVLAFVSCSSDNTPEGVVKEFVSCMKNGKYEKAIDLFYTKKPLTEKDKQGYVEILKKAGKQYEESGGLDGVEITNVTISEDGESAKVDYITKYGNGTTKKGSDKLVKVDGKWMLDSGK